METVNNAVNAASRAIWGEPNTATTESGREPVSGKTGDTSRGEPYDAGNIDKPISNDGVDKNPLPSTTGNAENDFAGDSRTANTTTSAVPDTTKSGVGNTPSTGPIRSELDHDKTGVISSHQPVSENHAVDNKPTSSNDVSGKGAVPSTGADPASASQETQKHQGADRPAEVPTGEGKRAVEESKAKAEDVQADKPKASEPNPVGSGKIPGQVGSEGLQKESHGEGTGETWIKTSGMKADGGDFDASQAGAGKEADRLLEEKGIHHDPASQGPPVEDSTEKDHDTKKPSIGKKIKAAFHHK